MKKIGILAVRTLNYGSLLQSYATQEILRSEGYDAEIILYKKTNKIKQALRLLYWPMFKTQCKVYFKKIYIVTIKRALKPYFDKKYAALNGFIDKYFISSPEYKGRKSLIAGAKSYRAFVLGSDQVWNPLNYGADYFSMSWIPDNITKITYAASFGVSSIPKYQKKKTALDLNRIDYISVREDSGKQIIKDLTERDVPVVVDPTLLVDFGCWKKFAEKPVLGKEKYIMCYFLGTTESHRTTAKELSKMLKLPIVTLPHGDEIVKADFGFGDILPEAVGPEEFVNLIANAEYVITDSFHGTVFSTMFRKKLIVFNRYVESANSTESTNSRLSSILGILGMKNRLFDSENGIQSGMFEEINYDCVHERLNELRRFSKDYLINALNSIK